MKLRNICVLLLCVCLLTTAVGTVHGQELAVQSALVPLVQQGAMPAAADSDRDLSAAEAAIREGLLNVEDQISLKRFGLSEEDLYTCFSLVVNQCPELYYVGQGQSTYRYSVMGGKVVDVYPVYNMTKGQILLAKETVKQKVQEICGQLDPSWNQVETMLYLHDYLCVNFEYDLTYSIYDMYRFLTEGTGVCQAYYLTYRYLLDELGIVSDYAVSDAMDHIWNMVCLDGVWYHVDVTFDDPAPDQLGRAEHLYFLRSDAGMAEGANAHHDWVTGPLAGQTGTAYDRWFWKGIGSAFVPVNGNWYYLDGSYGIHSVSSVLKASPKNVLPLSVHWPVIGQSGAYWNGWFTGLSGYHQELVYNAPTTVLAYDLETGKTRLMYELDTAEKHIYGSVIRDGRIDLQLAASPMDLYPEIRSVEMASVYKSTWHQNSTVGWVVSVLEPEDRTAPDRMLEVKLLGNRIDETIYCAVAACYKNGKMIGSAVCDLSASHGEAEMLLKGYQQADTVKFFLLGAGNRPCTDVGLLK